MLTSIITKIFNTIKTFLMYIIICLYTLITNFRNQRKMSTHFL